MNTRAFLLTALGLLSLLNTSHAALNDNGDGTVNDTEQNITWAQDANQVKTSCDADDAFWQAFDPTAVANGRTKSVICADDGKLNWFEAEAWIAVLNAQTYKGHTDWRQPDTAQPDATCESDFGGGQNGGFNCRGSELGHLFNTSLANPNDSGTGATGGTVGTGCFPPSCFVNTAPFNNAQSFAYWSGTEFAPNPATPGTSVPVAASSSAAIRLTTVSMSGLFVPDNKSQPLHPLKLSPPCQPGVSFC